MPTEMPAPEVPTDDGFDPFAGDDWQESASPAPSEETETTEAPRFSKASPGGRRALIITAVAILFGILTVGIPIVFGLRTVRTLARLGGSDVPSQIKPMASAFMAELTKQQGARLRPYLSPELADRTDSEAFQQIFQALSPEELESYGSYQAITLRLVDGIRYAAVYDLTYADGSGQLMMWFRPRGNDYVIEAIVVDPRSGTMVSVGPFSHGQLTEIYNDAIEDLARTALSCFLTVFFHGLILGLVGIGAFWLAQVVARWRLYDLAGEPGWAAVVPIYSTVVLARVAEHPGWWGLAMIFSPLIPFLGCLISLVLWWLICIGLAHRFGRSTLYGVALSLLPGIFFLHLAFTE